MPAGASITNIAAMSAPQGATTTQSMIIVVCSLTTCACSMSCHE
jgi:hypothetical protein